MTQSPALDSRPSWLLSLAVLTLTLPALLWAYWSTLADTARQWSADPQYSHGYLVPVFAAALLWLRRRRLPALSGPTLWGLALLLGALVLRLVGTWFYFSWLDPLSLLPCLAGVCLLAGGWPLLRWAWAAIAFLFFMIPLPYSLSLALADPLQTVATQSSTYALQTLGQPAVAEGHVILLDDVELGIVEACSGLRMLVVFFALATAVALVIKRPLWERLLVVVSAIPIALVSNIVRITVTGVLHMTAGSELANAVFHDLAGWLMMPLALLLLGLELRLFSRMILSDGPSDAAPVQTLAVRLEAPAPPRSRRAARRERPPAAKPFARS